MVKFQDLPFVKDHVKLYKSDPAKAQHVGPVAEDFHAAFGLGIDDKHVSPSDTAGVALVAIQELAARVEALGTENKRLEEKLRLLGQRNAVTRRTNGWGVP